jgi:hypothetical protein
MQCIEGAVVFVMTCNDANQNAGDSEECMIVAVHAAGCKKLEWHKMATVGKCFAKKEEEVTCNMQAELFEAIWCVPLGPFTAVPTTPAATRECYMRIRKQYT